LLIAQESYIQLPPDSTGKKLRMFQQTVSSQTVYAQGFFLTNTAGSEVGLVSSPIFVQFSDGAASYVGAKTGQLPTALDGSGFPWSRRASCWSVAVTERLPREVLVRPAVGGARVETVLAEWDDIAPPCSEALTQFLLAAQTGLRFARCERDERRARVVGFAATETLDADLPHGLLGAWLDL